MICEKNQAEENVNLLGLPLVPAA